MSAHWLIKLNRNNVYIILHAYIISCYCGAEFQFIYLSPSLGSSYCQIKTWAMLLMTRVCGLKLEKCAAPADFQLECRKRDELRHIIQVKMFVPLGLVEP